jgi:hypothetical protein
MSERAPEAVLWDFLRGALMAKALGIVADLGIANVLADGPRSVEDLAREVGADADVLNRLLRALASDGIFAEDEGIFRNTDTSELLLRPGWTEFAHLFGGVFYGAVADLDHAVRTGAVTFPEEFGSDFWGWLAAHSEERAVFDGAMAGERRRSADRLAALSWGDGETVVDVGGGNGALLVELLRRRPGLHGIVFDLPETHRDEGALGDDVEFVAGSFFESVPPGDAYVLSGVLHDWDDERALMILRTIGASAPTASRVLIVESVIPTDNEPNGSKWLDLLMHVLAGGRERTEDEWRALLDKAEIHAGSIEDGLIQASWR